MPNNDINLLFFDKLADIPYRSKILFYRDTSIHRSLNIRESLLLSKVCQILTRTASYIHIITLFFEVFELISDEIWKNEINIYYM